MEGPRLQDAQQLDLQRGIHLADFIQEDRPAVGAHFEPARPILEGPGERTALVAE
mgnify:CR=1 FL=1